MGKSAHRHLAVGRASSHRRHPQVSPIARAARAVLRTWTRRADADATARRAEWRIETLEPKLLLSADAVPVVQLVVQQAAEDPSAAHFARGDGQVCIAAASGTGGDPATLQFDGDIRPVDVLARREPGRAGAGDDLVLAIAGSSDSVRLESYFSAEPTAARAPIGSIRFASDGTVWTQADVQAQVAVDTDAAVMSFAAHSSDLYLFGKGDGQRTVSIGNAVGSERLDTVQLKAGVTPAEIALTRVDDAEFGAGSALQIAIRGRRSAHGFRVPRRWRASQRWPAADRLRRRHVLGDGRHPCASQQRERRRRDARRRRRCERCQSGLGGRHR
jgi:hypothetical protein